MSGRVVVFLAVSYGAAAVLTYLAFRRYPDQSVMAAVQWVLFYVVTVVYPFIWTAQQFRLLKELGLQHSRALHQRAWAPVIVGGTALLAALTLLFRVAR